MISINLIRSQVAPLFPSRGFNIIPVACHSNTDGPSAACYDSVTSTEQKISTVTTRDIKVGLSPELTDHLMGKSPLRLVVKRREFAFCPDPENNPNHFITQWKETLECGHKQIASCYTTPSVVPTAKRRRCPECKGQQPLLYRPYTPLPLKKDCLTLRVVDYLNWAQDNEERVHRRDDIAIARLAVILAGQGDPEPWRWAFMQLLGGTPEKLIPIFVARLAQHRNMALVVSPAAAETGPTPHSPGSLSPRKPVQSVGLPDGPSKDKEAVNKEEEA